MLRPTDLLNALRQVSRDGGGLATHRLVGPYQPDGFDCSNFILADVSSRGWHEHTCPLSRTTTETRRQRHRPRDGPSFREAAVPERRYEFRIAGRLSEQARAAFDGMDIDDVAAETVISGEVNDEG